MSLRHSSENLSVCTICRENVDADANSLRTACGHRFHKNCLVTWLKRSSSCPQCRAFCNGKDFGISQTPNRGARTRSRANTSANNIIIPTATGNDHSQTQHEVQSSNQVLAGNTPQDTNRLSDLQQNMSFPNNSELRSSNSNVSNAGRIASLINNWDIKFDGSPKLSVENFIYRIESMVVDTLSGNFNVLCENAQCIFVNEAKDWY